MFTDIYTGNISWFADILSSKLVLNFNTYIHIYRASYFRRSEPMPIWLQATSHPAWKATLTQFRPPFPYAVWNSGILMYSIKQQGKCCRKTHRSTDVGRSV
jgi:hypothetical protein